MADAKGSTPSAVSSGTSTDHQAPDALIDPFISLLKAKDMSVKEMSEWLEKICLKHKGVELATEGKAAEIWNLRLSTFFQAVLAEDHELPDLIWVNTEDGSLDPISVKWLENPAVHVSDVWTAIAFIMSIAAEFDTQPRTRDWHVELLIVFALLLREIANGSRSEIWVSAVVHILWTETGQAIIQTPLDTPNPSSDCSTSEPIKEAVRANEPSSEISGGHHVESPSSSAGETIEKTRQAVPKASVVTPDIASRSPNLQSTTGISSDRPQELKPSDASSGTSPAPSIHFRDHAVGSTTPSPLPPGYFEKLRESRRAAIEQALLDLDPKLDSVVKEIQEHVKKDNFGKCAETVPYLCIVCGGLKHREIHGLSFQPKKLNDEDPQAVLNGTFKPDNPPNPLHFLHRYGFITACEICCKLMDAINVKYIQYKRRKNGTPFRRYPDGTRLD